MERCFRSEQWDVSGWCGRESGLPAGLIRDAGLHRKAGKQDPNRGKQLSIQRKSCQHGQHGIHTKCATETSGHAHWSIHFDTPREQTAAVALARGVNRPPVRFWTVFTVRGVVKYVSSRSIVANREEWPGNRCPISRKEFPGLLPYGRTPAKLCVSARRASPFSWNICRRPVFSRTSGAVMSM